MYNTEWNLARSEVTDSFIEFVKDLEETLHEVDGQITVKESRGNTAAEVEVYNVEDPQDIFELIEESAIDSLGRGNYTAWSSGSSMTVSE